MRLQIPLHRIAFARSGDKNDTCNVGLLARDERWYEILRDQVSAERVSAHFEGLVNGPVVRYEWPAIEAFNFICSAALDGGGSRSLRMDNLGKNFSSHLLRLHVEVDEALLQTVEQESAKRSDSAEATALSASGTSNDSDQPSSDKPITMSLETTTEKVKALAEKAGGFGNTIKFTMDEGVIYLDGSGDHNTVSNEDKEANCTIKIKTEDMLSLLNGDLNPMMAFMSGKLKVDGDMGAAMKLQSLFS
jgi:putative sterol carrier protein